MRGMWQELVDVVFPGDCAGCGAPRVRERLCPRCRDVLLGGVPQRVRPDPLPEGMPVVHAAAVYGERTRGVLLAHKERGALGLARPLGAALAAAVRAGRPRAVGERETAGRTESSAISPGDARRGPGARSSGRCPLVLVPVPSARRAVAARGHDPVRRMALAAAGELRRSGVSVRVLSVLRQCRSVADQAGLSAPQRLRNVRGALEAVPGSGRLLAGAEVVLVDDLMTTGVSLAEASRAIACVHTARRGASEGEGGRPGGRVPRAAVVAVRLRDRSRTAGCSEGAYGP